MNEKEMNEMIRQLGQSRIVSISKEVSAGLFYIWIKDGLGRICKTCTTIEDVRNYMISHGAIQMRKIETQYESEGV